MAGKSQEMHSLIQINRPPFGVNQNINQDECPLLLKRLILFYFIFNVMIRQDIAFSILPTAKMSRRVRFVHFTVA